MRWDVSGNAAAVFYVPLPLFGLNSVLVFSPCVLLESEWYNYTVVRTAWNNSCFFFFLLERSDFPMIDNQSTAAYTFPTGNLISLSVNKTIQKTFPMDKKHYIIHYPILPFSKSVLYTHLRHHNDTIIKTQWQRQTQ